MTALTQGGFFLWTLYPRMAAVTFATLTSVQHLIILISVFFFWGKQAEDRLLQAHISYSYEI